eukprot:Nk52_evm5s214 gene=Nk52_evmTU5s214
MLRKVSHLFPRAAYSCGPLRVQSYPRPLCCSPALNNADFFCSYPISPVVRCGRLYGSQVGAQRIGEEEQTQLTLAILKPDISSHPVRVAHILKLIRTAETSIPMDAASTDANAMLQPPTGLGFEIVRQGRFQWSREEAQKFYEEHKGRFFYGRLVDFISSGEMTALVLRRKNAIKEWRRFLGPTRPFQARNLAEWSLRGQYGISDTRNCAHGSDSNESAKREISLFFPDFNVDAEWKICEEMDRCEGRGRKDSGTGVDGRSDGHNGAVSGGANANECKEHKLKVLNLYRRLLKAAQRMPTKTRRDAIIGQIKADFHMHRHLRMDNATEQESINTQLQYGEISIENILVQADHLSQLLEKGEDKLMIPINIYDQQAVSHPRKVVSSSSSLSSSS